MLGNNDAVKWRIEKQTATRISNITKIESKAEDFSTKEALINDKPSNQYLQWRQGISQEINKIIENGKSIAASDSCNQANHKFLGLEENNGEDFNEILYYLSLSCK